MNCPQCHYDCPPEFAFCPKCGAALGAASPVERAEPILADLRKALPADRLEAALERGKLLDVDAVLAEIMAES